MRFKLIVLFYSQYGVDVLGIDLSDEMICKANEYRENLAENIRIRYVFLIFKSKCILYFYLMYKTRAELLKHSISGFIFKLLMQ